MAQDKLWAINFGKRIKKRLKELRITQRELAYRTGLSEGAISKYISGSITPSVIAILRIAASLDMSLDELVGLERGH